MGLDTVELLQIVEDHFSISIPNAEAQKIITVGDFHDTVARHLQPKPEDLSAIQAEINQIIADHAGVDLSEIAPHKSLTSDLGMD